MLNSGRIIAGMLLLTEAASASTVATPSGSRTSSILASSPNDLISLAATPKVLAASPDETAGAKATPASADATAASASV